MKKKILITGADGFIGSHLVEKLYKLGFSIRATSLYNSFNSQGWLDTLDNKILKKIEIIKCDISDSSMVDTIVKKCDIVINLAALIGIPYSYSAPESYVKTNVYGTLNLLSASRKYKIKKFIHTSTSEIYGNPLYLPIDEKHPAQAFSPYSATKISADQLVMSFYRSFNLNASILRPFNTFGPRQSLRAVIPTIINQVLMGRKEIILGSTNPKRDFSYVDDTINGFINVIKSNQAKGEIINLGSGYQFSIIDTVKIISKIMGKRLKIKIDNKRVRPKKSEIYNLLSNNKKAKKLLKWKPIYCGKRGFESGLIKTVEWYSKEQNLKKFNELDYVV